MKMLLSEWLRPLRRYRLRLPCRPSPASRVRMMVWTRSAYSSLVILDRGLFVSVPKTVQAHLIEVPSNKLQPYRKPGGCGPTRHRETRMARQVGRPCKAG